MDNIKEYKRRNNIKENCQTLLLQIYYILYCDILQILLLIFIEKNTYILMDERSNLHFFIDNFCKIL